MVELLVAGLSNRAIAKVTNRTEATVKWHLKHVFQKLGVSSRVQLILMAVQGDEPRVRSAPVSNESSVSL